ncbi:MAG: Alcohol dehydrogenase zinc-binding domain protein [Microbacterium sp.]|jgi:NADPH2:quinone reductase|uniref:alcohol dehydrogenase catalytic domain-containing protein n=1 Tax=Microbacterium sp. TaxID=51671 RepID=UPI002603363B|nr:zinc-binding dehydrogenase [Microbacterium sp.]MDF2561006.1 Alcohol dehydrogenase zinc-binding domain protein [Microbacterium sp.]
MSADAGITEENERETMRAIVQREFGESDVLRIEETPLPIPGEGEVRVRVAAAGVHAVDLDIRRDAAPPSMPRPTLPMTPGREIAGIVDAVGAGVDASLVGERVVVHVGFRSGGYAEFALAAASALHPIAEGATFSQAVATIGTGRTAQLVWGAARIRSTDVVVVPGASGGLGGQLVQLALSEGATVVALHGGSAKRDVVEGLALGEKHARGRLVPLDANDESWPERMAALLDGAQPSVLLDGVGGATARAALESLGRGGRIVIIGWSSGEILRLDTDDIVRGSLTVTVPLGRPVADLRALETAALAALAEGRTSPPVDEYRLEDAAAAHDAIAQRRQRGKIVLVP